MRCYWANDPEIGRYHVPGCMGAAVYGREGCTCRASDKRKTMEQKIVDLEERIRVLEGLLPRNDEKGAA